MQLDRNTLATVRAIASAWAARPTPCLHALVNNAGIFDMGSTSRGLTADGHEAHWGTNYLAPALLSLLMLPHLRSAEPGAAKAGAGFAPRVVFVSSKLHQLGCVDLSNPSFAPSAPSAAAASATSASAASGRQRPSSRPYSALAGYAQSKLAEVRRGGGGRGPRGLTSPPTDGRKRTAHKPPQVMFCSELERRLPAGSGLRAISVHPGNVVARVPPNPNPRPRRLRGLSSALGFSRARSAAARRRGLTPTWEPCRRPGSCARSPSGCKSCTASS